MRLQLRTALLLGTVACASALFAQQAPKTHWEPYRNRAAPAVPPPNA